MSKLRLGVPKLTVGILKSRFARLQVRAVCLASRCFHRTEQETTICIYTCGGDINWDRCFKMKTDERVGGDKKEGQVIYDPSSPE